MAFCRRTRIALLGWAFVSLPAAAFSASAPAPPTHGVAAEVTAGAATLWARCAGPTTLHFAIRSAHAGSRASWQAVAVDAPGDFTGQATFGGLAAETAHEYRAWCAARRPDFSTPGGAAGRLVTPPAADAARAVRFVWGGDAGGQNACRDAAEGYRVFDRVQDEAPQFFLALGDLIYADDRCRARGRYGNEQIPGPEPAATLAEYWEHWRYNRSDPSLQRLLSTTPYYAVWDDHEINTDAGPEHDVSPRAAGRHLLPIARRAFLDYQPIAAPAARLYRSARWGKHVEVFLLDTRSYRDANSARDDPRRPKTLLGMEQRSWLIDGLAASDATWKIVACSVPIAVPTGNEDRGRDGWANLDGAGGFENELRAILAALRERAVQNLVFLSTDIHFASAFRYAPFGAGAGFSFHEFISGPLHAGIFARRELDPTFAPERLFFHGPEKPVAGLAEAKTWFNFGVVEVSEAGKMKVRYVDANGRTLWEKELEGERTSRQDR
jgi:alkaline phosphatase D